MKTDWHWEVKKQSEGPMSSQHSHTTPVMMIGVWASLSWGNWVHFFWVARERVLKKKPTSDLVTVCSRSVLPWQGAISNPWTSWMEQSPHRARGLVWLQVEHTSLVLRLTQDSCIWNSGLYSRDTSNLWLRTTGHTQGSPWSQACDLQLFWVSSWHTAHHGML